MDKKKELLMFLSLAESMIGDSYLNQSVYLDEEVNDCLIKMYFVMMIEEGHPDYERLFNEFLLAYHSLNDEKQKLVREDFKKIIEAQNRNEREKVKRKGEMKYE